MSEKTLTVNITITNSINTMYQRLAQTTEFSYAELLSGALEYAMEDISFIFYMSEKSTSLNSHIK